MFPPQPWRAVGAGNNRRIYVFRGHFRDKNHESIDMALLHTALNAASARRMAGYIAAGMASDAVGTFRTLQALALGDAAHYTRTNIEKFTSAQEWRYLSNADTAVGDAVALYDAPLVAQYTVWPPPQPATAATRPPLLVRVPSPLALTVMDWMAHELAAEELAWADVRAAECARYDQECIERGRSFPCYESGAY